MSAAHASADLSVNDVSVQASRFPSAASFTISRTGDLSSVVTVHYQTEDGTARAGVNYTATAGTATLPAGASSVAVVVPVEARKLRGASRPLSFSLSLSAPAAAPGGGGVSFANAAQAVLPTPVESIAVADFNGDGKTDAAFSNPLNGRIDFLRNDTTEKGPVGSFSPSATVSGINGPWHVIATDLNADGRPDLVVTVINTNQFVVLMNSTPTGSANFSFVKTTLATPDFGFNEDAAIADFNGDGRPDIALASPGSSGAPGTNRALVYLNTTPKGAMTPTLTLAATPRCSPSANSLCDAIVALDVNGDGKPDLAVGNIGSFDVSILMNTTPAGATTASFAAAIAFPSSDGPSSLAVGDFDGDGKPDIVSANNGTSQTGTAWNLFVNTTAQGALTPTFTVSSQTNGSPFAVTVADMDNDGKPDILMTNLVADSSSDGAVDIFLNRTVGTGPVTFVKGTSMFFGDEPNAVAVADFNRDGRIDFVTSDHVNGGGTAFFFGIVPTSQPTATIVDGTGIATLLARQRGQ